MVGVQIRQQLDSAVQIGTPYRKATAQDAVGLFIVQPPAHERCLHTREGLGGAVVRLNLLIFPDFLRPLPARLRRRDPWTSRANMHLGTPSHI
jgi:hypothetical protein